MPLSLSDLAERSGLPARTIRFYIARGILAGPVKSGRAAEYTDDHLARLERIKSLQAKGRTLSQIAPALDAPKPSAAPPTAWWQHAVADDVIVMVRADGTPWRTRQIRAAIEEFARSVQPGKDPDR